jgi:NADPH:quinone reductase-like Zn-dependent oxidoreductase
MKSIQIHKHSNDPEQIQYKKDAPRPYPGRRGLGPCHRYGVTPTELSWPGIWKAEDGSDRTLPIVPGHEMSGIIEEIGPGITDLKLGSAIYGIIGFSQDGAAAEYTLQSPQRLLLKHDPLITYKQQLFRYHV